jgi:CRISPR-associated protein Cmr3
VPAGSVFYFEGTGPNPDRETARLAGVLQARCRSDFYGEKGFGLGVCGTWDFHPGGTSA